MSTLLIIDSHAVLHRAYHALPKETFKNQGQTVNAVYGFFSMLLAAVFELKPNFLIACFDSPGPTFRQEKYLAYQANRLKTDEELILQIKMTRKIVKNSGIPTLVASGFEADDVIGTIVEKVPRTIYPRNQRGRQKSPERSTPEIKRAKKVQNRQNNCCYWRQRLNAIG